MFVVVALPRCVYPVRYLLLNGDNSIEYLLSNGVYLWFHKVFVPATEIFKILFVLSSTFPISATLFPTIHKIVFPKTINGMLSLSLLGIFSSIKNSFSFFDPFMPEG